MTVMLYLFGVLQTHRLYRIAGNPNLKWWERALLDGFWPLTAILATIIIFIRRRKSK